MIKLPIPGRGPLTRRVPILILAGALLFGLLGSGLSAAAKEGHDGTSPDPTVGADAGRGRDSDAAEQEILDPAVGGQPATGLAIGVAAVINDEPINLRADASTGATIVAALATGTAVTITGGPVAADDLTWYQVETGQGSGWVAGQYLTGAGSGAATGSGFVAGTPVVVNIDGALNLRSEARLDAGIIAELPAGTAATILSGPETADSLTWYQIETAEGTGWVASDYLASA